MPKLLYFGFPARGHTVPSLPLVAALVRSGVHVEYCSIEAYKDLIEASGARFVAYPTGVAKLARPTDLDAHLTQVLTVTAQVLPQLLARADTADLVMFDASALWGEIIARYRGLPSVASITTFAFSRTLLQLLGGSTRSIPLGWDACADALATLNADYGAGLRDHLDLMVPTADLKLVYTSRLLQPAGQFFDSSHLFLGPLVGARAREGQRAIASGPRPLAYVALGTIFNRNAALLLLVSEALTARGWQVIVAHGDAASEQAAHWPAHVQSYAFVDQIGVLAQAELFVSHGGMNSVSEALAHAVPMVIIPQGVDQYLVARQTARLGAAVVIERTEVAAASLSAAVERIERERAAFVNAAARIQHSFIDVTPVVAAVNGILALMRTQQQ